MMIDMRQIWRRSRRVVAALLVVLMLVLLTVHMMTEVRKYDYDQLRLMTTSVEERTYLKKNNLPITPSVEERAEAYFRDYPRTMAFLIVSYLLLSIWSWWGKKYLHTYISAAFLLAGIGCSYKFMFAGFNGWTGESGFLVMGVFVGIAAYLIFLKLMNMQISPRMYGLLSIAVVVLLVWLKLFGVVINGNKGWIDIGSIRIQPSEFIKCMLIMLGAASMNLQRRGLVYSILCLVSCGAMVLFHDLGMACVMLALFLLMTYVIFDKKRYAVGLIVLGLVVLYVVAKNTDYVADRLAGYLHAMTRTDSYQQRGFIVEIIKAGWSGMGVANATAFTSMTAAGNDAALAGILAVFGLPMLVTVMCCYVVILLCFASNHGTSITSHPILFQLALVFMVQAVLNLCGALDVLPFTGVTAVMISTGGSSTITTCAMLGVAAAAMTPHMRQPEKRKE